MPLFVYERGAPHSIYIMCVCNFLTIASEKKSFFFLIEIRKMDRNKLRIREFSFVQFVVLYNLRNSWAFKHSPFTDLTILQRSFLCSVSKSPFNRKQPKMCMMYVIWMVIVVCRLFLFLLQWEYRVYFLNNNNNKIFTQIYTYSIHIHICIHAHANIHFFSGCLLFHLQNL